MTRSESSVPPDAPNVIHTSAARQQQLRGIYKETQLAAELARVGPAWNAMQYRVLYLVAGRERKTAWFRSKDRAQAAFNIIRARGHQAVIYCD